MKICQACRQILWLMETRAWKGFDADRFRDDLLKSRLCMPPGSHDAILVDELQSMYDTTLTELLDKHAPSRSTKRRRQPLTPWFDSECAAARRKTRALERRYRLTRLASDRLAWTAQVRSMHQFYSTKQNTYWTERVEESHGNPKKLWNTLNGVLCRDKRGTSAPISDELSAQGFMDAFTKKVEAVRLATKDAPCPNFNEAGCFSNFDTFHIISATEAKQLVTGAANKQCALDPVPTWLVKRFVDDLSPFIAHLINATFLSGYFPASQKCAILTPLLKKASRDPCDFNNYRPVSNLSFISKIIECAAYKQIYGDIYKKTDYCRKSNLPIAYHSTETAVLDVLSDAFMAADAGKVTLLGLLDQSSAFDMVDHKILLRRLEISYGICGLPLQWITSDLSGRTQYVQFNGRTSEVALITCGVPQGSVLGPLLFIVYTAEVIDVVDRFGYAVHVYADDLQVHTHVDPPESPGIVQTFSDCVEAVKDWMS